jgi:hypothetical protein
VVLKLFDFIEKVEKNEKKAQQQALGLSRIIPNDRVSSVMSFAHGPINHRRDGSVAGGCEYSTSLNRKLSSDMSIS